jgi:pantoate--beta-alanine ligase
MGLEPFVGLARAALSDVAELGPAAALTGPAARGDDATLERHRAALDPAELPGYDAGVQLARRLASRGPDGNTTAPCRDAPAVRVITSATEFAAVVDEARAGGRQVGLVPTMGALHLGHRSLIERAASECDVVAVTIFVNPLQFNETADLARYPRNLDGDVAQARQAGASLVFAPSVAEMYPQYPTSVATSVHVAGVSEILEGASRPGHFDGVATVVAKLFALAGRCRAYFGDKDFQQLVVVRQMVADLSIPVDIVGCPTVREDDGVAASSRNARLTPGERQAARVLYRAVQAGQRLIAEGERDPAAVRAAMHAELASEPLVRSDYAEVVEVTSLRPPAVIEGDVRLVVAATVGTVRLIDNGGAIVPPYPGSPVSPRRMEGAEHLVLSTTGETREER